MGFIHAFPSLVKALTKEVRKAAAKVAKESQADVLSPVCGTRDESQTKRDRIGLKIL